MSHGNHGAEQGAPVLEIPEAPSLERASLITPEEHVSRTGRAQSHWSFYPAPNRTMPGRLLIVGGLGGVESAYANVAEEVAQAGLDAVTMNLPTYQHSHHQYHKEHLFSPERLLAQMVRRIARDIKLEYGDEPIDATGHSTGGPAITQAAHFDSELFHSITLWQSAGITKGGIARLGLRIPSVALNGLRARTQLRNNLMPRTNTLAREYGNYAINYPRRMLEAIAVCKSDIREPLARVVEAGTKVAAVLANRDAFFPPDEATRTLEGIGGILTSRMDGCHLLPQTHPLELAEQQLQIHETFYSDEPHHDPILAVA